MLVRVNQGRALGKLSMDLHFWTFSTLRFTFPVLMLFFGQPRGVGMSEAVPSRVCDPFGGSITPGIAGDLELCQGLTARNFSPTSPLIQLP